MESGGRNSKSLLLEDTVCFTWGRLLAVIECLLSCAFL